MLLTLLEKLQRSLPEMVHLCLLGHPGPLIFGLQNIEVLRVVSSIRHPTEGVQRHHCFLATLFAPENIIYPRVEIRRNIWRLNSLSEQLHEFIFVTSRPLRQVDPLHLGALPVLFLAEVALVEVCKHLWQEIKLRN